MDDIDELFEDFVQASKIKSKLDKELQARMKLNKPNKSLIGLEGLNFSQKAKPI